MYVAVYYSYENDCTIIRRFQSLADLEDTLNSSTDEEMREKKIVSAGYLADLKVDIVEFYDDDDGNKDTAFVFGITGVELHYSLVDDV